MKAAQTKTPAALAGLVCLVLSLACIPSAVLAQGASWPGARVAFVDFQKAIDLSMRGKMARKELQQTVTARQQRIEQLEAQLRKLESDYRKKSSELAGTGEWDDYQARFGYRVKELRREGEDIQEEVALAERKLTEELLGELTVLVQRYARKQGYNLVLEKNVTKTLHMAEAADLTDKIIELYDSGALLETKEPKP